MTKTLLGLDPDVFAQDLRRAHCAHADAGNGHHACIGVCVIDREGVRLSCEACGDGDQSFAPTAYEIDSVRPIVEAAGLRWSALSPETQRAVVAAARSRR